MSYTHGVFRKLWRGYWRSRFYVVSPEPDAVGVVKDEVPNGTLTLTGVAPTTRTVVRDPVDAGSLTLTGFAPNEYHIQTDSPPNGELTLTGIAPVDHTNVVDSPPVGGLTLTGFAPATRTTVRDPVPAGALTLTGVAPEDRTVAAVVDQVPAGALTLTGFAPNEYHIQTDSPPAGSLTLTGVAPTTRTIVKDRPLGICSYLDLPGSNGNYASTPHSTALNITGDIDVRVDLSMDDWTPTANHTWIAKQDNGAGESLWGLSIDNTGVAFRHSEDGDTNITNYVPAAWDTAPNPQ